MKGMQFWKTWGAMKSNLFRHNYANRCFFALFIMLISLVGCVSLPNHSAPISKTTAAISGDFANIVAFYSDGSAHVKIMDIDGKEYKTFGTVIISSGIHTVHLVVTNLSAVSDFSYEINVKGNARYQFIAFRRKSLFNVKLLDVTDANKEQVISKKTVAINKVNEPIIIIPY